MLDSDFAVNGILAAAGQVAAGAMVLTKHRRGAAVLTAAVSASLLLFAAVVATNSPAPAEIALLVPEALALLIMLALAWRPDWRWFGLAFWSAWLLNSAVTAMLIYLAFFFHVF